MASLGTAPGELEKMNLTDDERNTLQHIERLGASISLVGVSAIFIVYGLFPRVRTVPNTFIFFASIANVGASIACLIGFSGILSGEESALCQAQAFLFEMFMQSDPWWSFAMAVNVYMVFFMAYPPSNLHNNLWIYCLVCFGIPATPAFICLVYRPHGKPIYGDATMWCWINDEYNQLRIFTYYMPIWTCIVLSTLIYVAVGYHVFHQRNQLRNLTLSNQARDPSGAEPRTTEKEQQSYGTVTTEVQITAESSGSRTPPSTPTGSIVPVLHKPAQAATHDPWGSPSDDIELGLPTTRCHVSSSHGSDQKNNNNNNNNHNNPFTTTSITISSAHYPRESEAARGAGASRGRGSGWFRPPAVLAGTWRKFQRKLANLDPIKLAYLRTSFVFALSVLVTWTPSSINRVYALAHPDRNSYALNLAGAVVLPLQGLWNAVIFAATSWGTLRDELHELRYDVSDDVDGGSLTRRLWWWYGRGRGRGHGWLCGGNRGLVMLPPRQQQQLNCAERFRCQQQQGTKPRHYHNHHHHHHYQHQQQHGLCCAFRSRDESLPGNRELQTLSRTRTTANVRVIRGGSL